MTLLFSPPAASKVAYMFCCCFIFSPPALREAKAKRACVLLMFFLNFVLISVKTNYLNIYVTDLHEIFRFGKTFAVY